VIRRDGEALHVTGPLTMDTVPALVSAVEEHLIAGATQIDFSGVTEVDSSAVALTLEWQRVAARNHVSLGLLNLPASMLNLSKLYGVSDLVQPR
jgi:phospholipid transport system transporter-binding protein